eukprot:scaffold120_cov202-Prasinococcus_capsulatus_cf.AAC.1
MQIAADADMSLTELAIRFVKQHPCVASVVIGASEPGQLGELLNYMARGPLPSETLASIQAAHVKYPNPAP